MHSNECCTELDLHCCRSSVRVYEGGALAAMIVVIAFVLSSVACALGRRCLRALCKRNPSNHPAVAHTRSYGNEDTDEAYEYDPGEEVDASKPPIRDHDLHSEGVLKATPSGTIIQCVELAQRVAGATATSPTGTPVGVATGASSATAPRVGARGALIV